MWTAWARGIAERFFPLCSKTVFRLTLDESINSLHCSEGCESWSSPINTDTCRCTIRRTVLCSVRRPLPVKWHIHALFTAETVTQVAEPWFRGCPSPELGRSTQPDDQAWLCATVRWKSWSSPVPVSLLLKPLPIPVVCPQWLRYWQIHILLKMYFFVLYRRLFKKWWAVEQFG